MSENNGNMAQMDMDREVVRCKVCGLVQYRTRTGNCRRCLRMLPPKVEYLIPPPSPQELADFEQRGLEATVESLLVHVGAIPTTIVGM